MLVPCLDFVLVVRVKCLPHKLQLGINLYLMQARPQVQGGS